MWVIFPMAAAKPLARRVYRPPGGGAIAVLPVTSVFKAHCAAAHFQACGRAGFFIFPDAGDRRRPKAHSGVIFSNAFCSPNT
jgi:hypothetical protein